MDRRCAAGYLAAMIDGEGHISRGRHRCIEIANTDADIIQSTLEACRVLGIETNPIRWRDGKNGRKDAARVIISRLENLQRVAELVPIQSARKKLALDRQIQSYRKKRPLPVLIETLVQMYESGESAQSIADKYGVSDHVIRRRLAQHGVRLRTQSEAAQLTKHRGLQQNKMPNDEELRRLYRVEQLSTTEIGRQFDVSAGTVSRWLRKIGEPIRGARDRMILIQSKWAS